MTIPADVPFVTPDLMVPKTIRRAGRRQLAAETEGWARTVAIVARLLESDS